MRGRVVQPKRTWSFAVRRAVQEGLNYLFPEERNCCVLCKRPMSVPTPRNQRNDEIAGPCLFCAQELAAVRIESRVLKLRVRGTGSAWAAVPIVSAVRHQGIVRHTIRQWKYDGLLAASGWLGGLVSASIQAVWEAERPDFVVPVPTTVERMRRRGYDHVRLLVDPVATALRVPVCPCLHRGGHRAGEEPEQQWRNTTRSQTGMNRTMRASSVRQEYTVVQDADVRGTRVCLVDDIVTTGSTLQACAQALLAAGATVVKGATIAWEE